MQASLQRDSGLCGHELLGWKDIRVGQGGTEEERDRALGNCQRRLQSDLTGAKLVDDASLAPHS